MIKFCFRFMFWTNAIAWALNLVNKIDDETRYVNF